MGRNLASLRYEPQDMDLDAAPVFPGGFKLGLASAGLFLWTDRLEYREYSVRLQDLAFPA
ncbi:hypothetical protein GGE68_001040 [Rhizobium leguminosarum]|nr:hypothetical protein [Rhizobium leguminosarum]